MQLLITSYGSIYEAMLVLHRFKVNFSYIYLPILFDFHLLLLINSFRVS